MADSTTSNEAAAPEAGATFGDRLVLLVVPPFRSVVRPALGVSLLKAGLRDRGFNARVLYLNFRFAERIGVPQHEALGLLPVAGLGEFLFSCVYFNRTTAHMEAYARDVLLATAQGRALAARLRLGEPVSGIRRLAREAAGFVSEAVDEMDRCRPWMVGFTSSFQENLAAMALCRGLKAKREDIVTVMGGANVQGEMGEEMLRRFPELDYVAQGECDLAFPELVERVAKGRSAADVPGVLSRDARPPAALTPCLSSEELERSPFPDFDDYFSRLATSRCAQAIQPGLPIESSRGCWWGAKDRCLFCGLNGTHQAFRRKSGARLKAEVEHQVNRHGVRSFGVVDNMLDMLHFKDFFPSLAQGSGLRFFWETSGRLSPPQVEALARAGVTHIQPGIESLSDRSLAHMHKPTTRQRNLQTLRACEEVGIKAHWNHLFGVPGETDEDLPAISRDMALVTHLHPPSAAHLVRLQRFSRYFEEHGRHGLGAIRPAAVYAHLYPFDDVALCRLAYHFECEWGDARAVSPAYRRLQHLVRAWRRAYPRSVLWAFPLGSRLLIIDTRPGRTSALHLLSPPESRVLEAAGSLRSSEQIGALLQPLAAGIGVAGVLERLRSRGLVIDGAEGWLGLPVQLSRRVLPGRVRFCDPLPGGHVREGAASKLVRALLRGAHFRS